MSDPESPTEEQVAFSLVSLSLALVQFGLSVEIKSHVSDICLCSIKLVSHAHQLGRRPTGSIRRCDLEYWKTLICHLSVVFVLMSMQTVCAEISYVDVNAVGNNDGTSWANAFVELRDALSAVPADHSNTEIWVAKGMYTATDATGSRAASFRLAAAAAIYGGFPSGGADFVGRDPESYETVLSGDFKGNDTGSINRDDNSYHVVYVDANTADVLLNGITISGGYANGDGEKDCGGAVFLKSGKLTIESCLLIDNEAVVSGGAVYSSGSQALIVGCEFEANSASISGGGIYFNKSYSQLLGTFWSQSRMALP